MLAAARWMTLGLLAPLRLAAQAPEAGPQEVLAALQQEALSLAATVETAAARAVLAAVPRLPPPEGRRIYRDPASRRLLSEADVAALDPAARAAWQAQDLSPVTYYYTRYGSPLAYLRPCELLGRAGLDDWHGRRVLDYGYGGIGPLRLLALCGAEAVGVDVDPFLSALYAPERAAAAAQQPAGAPDDTGRVRLLEGRWPTEPALVAAVGEGYDVFLSKNTLKRGYVHPERSADPAHLIDLGVDDATFLSQVARVLKPGGLALLYNICPPPAAADQPYVPWADGHSPFSAEQWEAAGFELLAFDQEDHVAARAQGVLLGWGEAAELETGIFCWYTLARKLPAGQAPAAPTR